jgi:hypothetical protein
MRRARPKAWLGALALAVAVGTLAAPATAGAENSSANSTPAGSMLTPGTPGGYSGAPLQKGDIGVPQKYASDTTLVSGSNADDGFDWLSAAIGAAAAMALVGLGAAAFLTVRRRTAVSPSAASTS